MKAQNIKITTKTETVITIIIQMSKSLQMGDCNHHKHSSNAKGDSVRARSSLNWKNLTII